MWAGIYYGVAFLLAALSVSAPRLRRRAHARVPDPTAAAASWASVVATAALLIFGTGSAVGFGVFYHAHWTGPFAGSIRYGAERELSRYHILLSLLCFAVAGNMAWRFWQKRLDRAGMSGVAAIGAAAAAAKAFVLTIPLSGDEGVFLWILLGPFFGSAALLLVVFALLLMIRAGVEYRRKHAELGG